MKHIFEVVMRNTKSAEIEVSRITYRIMGMTRVDAIAVAKQLAGKDYEVYFVVAGPRLDE